MATYCKNLTIGVQAGTTRTLYASWTLSPASASNRLDHYDVKWDWADANGVWYNGNDSEFKPSQIHPTYSAPENAFNIRCRVIPRSKTYEKEVNTYNKKGKKTGKKKVTKNYWSGTAKTAFYYMKGDYTPPKLSAPTVTIDGTQLTAKLENIPTYQVNGTTSTVSAVEFIVVKNDSATVSRGTAWNSYATATYTCNVTSGGRYKVMARGWYGPQNLYGDWSDFSSNVETAPEAPRGFSKHTVISPTSVQLYWNEVPNAETYDIEYALDKSYFDVSSDVQSVSTETAITSRIINNLESGRTWFFRLRACNRSGKSGWSEIYSIVLGKIPAAPTTWAASTAIVVGENADLYWMHNSEDGSSQQAAQIEITIGADVQTITLTGDAISSDPEIASLYSITTAEGTHPEGTAIEWRVRTRGILTAPDGGYGEWSTKRLIKVHAVPNIELSVSQEEDYSEPLSSLTMFPIYIRAVATPRTQVAVGWNVKVISDESYTTEDEIGRPKSVIAGAEVYSNFFVTDTNTLELVLSAGDLSLEDDTSYTLSVSVAMDSGLTAEISQPFDVKWDEEMYEPDAEIAIDFSNLSAYITPYCGRAVALEKALQNDTGEDINDSLGNVITTYNASEEGELIPDVTLSVYRREYDGRFKLLASGIQNDRSTTVTDPHPALDFARYRIVAMSTRTGQIGFSDLPGVPIGETGIVLQWDEEWQNFNTTEDVAELVQSPRNGSTLILPYNISITDKYGMDVTLAEYIGRAHPVSYYGTQLGVGGSWSSSVPASDADTRFALRRLAIYPGDVYVREPSGVGYWANVNVSFSKSYDNMLSPISLDVTRVEGGV